MGFRDTGHSFVHSFVHPFLHSADMPSVFSPLSPVGTLAPEMSVLVIWPSRPSQSLGQVDSEHLISVQ